MDGNKDEALKCLKIGRDALDSGDRKKALKFLTKARRLDPSVPIDDLLSKIDYESAADDENSSGPTTKDSSEPLSNDSGPRRRPSAAGSSSSSSPKAGESVKYTEENIAIVREIKMKKDYYEILGLDKNCTVEDIRKAYRKLSLKVHPDKNKAPGSEDAFKSVSKAFQCLNDDESRKKYDVVGSDEPVYERRPTTRHQGYHEAEFDAEEIFRNFFFGGMGPGTTTQFGTFSFGTGMGGGGGGGVRAGNNNNGSSARMLIQLIPVLIILLLNFLPNSNEPIYQLYRQYPYQNRFATEKGVNFFVKSPNFEQEYPPDGDARVALEARVERDYVYVLSHNCENEMQRYHWGFVQETPSCDSLKQFRMLAAS
ncbi:chaperone protein dnaJ 49-like [Impatiens glandulifera]|uniref:chaperone protein dnaJ 49-like n=1 Tax=Impatiens glandulifera TaxID=253017 RepID=UPI001FB08C75|nr:chaperone protein dnaJ 49-like [Impatiens glandulifera]